MISSPPKKILHALNGNTVSPPPIWMMRQAGRYLSEYRQTRTQAKNFLDFCYTPELAVEVTMQPIRRYGFDAAIIFSDILVIPDALGQTVSFVEGKGPILSPVRTVEDLSALSLERVSERLSPVMEVVRTLRKELPKPVTLIGFAGSPWTVALYMVEGKGGTDASYARRWAFMGAQGKFPQLIDMITKATTDYLLEQINNGAEVIQLFDSWAGVLSAELFDAYVIAPTKKIVSRLKEHAPHVPIIGFPRGCALRLEEFVRETGVDGVSIDSSVPPEWAAKTLQSSVCVQGNLDNQLLVCGGDALVSHTQRMVRALKDGPYIVNLGHGIVPDTPPDNVARMIEAIRTAGTADNGDNA